MSRKNVRLVLNLTCGLTLLALYSADIQAATPTPTALPGFPLLVNGELTSSDNNTPTGWNEWKAGLGGADYVCFRGNTGNSFWFLGNVGLWQDNHKLDDEFKIGDRIRFGGYFYIASSNPLSSDSGNFGRIDLEFRRYLLPYGDTPVASASAAPSINYLSPKDVWIFAGGEAVVPPNTERVRLVIRMGDDHQPAVVNAGPFFGDDLFMNNLDYFTPTSTLSSTPTPLPRSLNPRRGAAVPNPFVPTRGQVADFQYTPAAPGSPVVIRVVSLKGVKVRTLENVLAWDGRDEAGRLCEGGVYFYQIENGGERISGKVVLIK